MKDKTKTVVTGTSGVYSLNQGNLTISSVSPNLEGANLTCIGENAFGSAKANTTIRMVYGMYIDPPVLCIRLCFMISRVNNLLVLQNFTAARRNGNILWTY